MIQVIQKIKKEYQIQTLKTNIYAYEYRIKYFKILTSIFMYVRIINPCNRDETKSIQLNHIFDDVDIVCTIIIPSNIKAIRKGSAS